MPVTIRIAVPDDAAGLAEVAAATFPLACPPHTTEEAKATFIAEVLSESRFAEYLSDPERALFLAQEPDGLVVGYTMLVFTEPTDPDVLAAISVQPSVELSKCYVRAGHHGVGVAAQLMSESLERARAHGARGVWLGVNEENERAQRFYAKHGFERVGTKRFLVGDRFEDDYVLELGLSPQRP